MLQQRWSSLIVFFCLLFLILLYTSRKVYVGEAIDER